MSRSDTPALAPRLDALGEAAELAAGRLPEDVVAGADAVVRAAGERQALSAEHTVVGFFGATGSGKSSLFNALTGRDLARVAATRPTTSEPLAAVWGVGRGQGLDPEHGDGTSEGGGVGQDDDLHQRASRPGRGAGPPTRASVSCMLILCSSRRAGRPGLSPGRRPRRRSAPAWRTCPARPW